MSYQPPYKISTKVLSLVADISEAAAGMANLETQFSPRLRKQNRIKTIVGTLAIEGNRLGIDQVTAILEGKTVRGSLKEINEVRGAIESYDAIEQYQAHSIKDLLSAHKKMTENILLDGGQFREKSVAVHKDGEVIHVAPPATRVHLLMKNLLLWLKTTEEHALIKSCVFHYELEYIHPFSDGNGRMGRLWQTLILGQWRALFYALPIENTIKDNQTHYYKALQVADKRADCTVFIEFMLTIILTSLERSDPVSDLASDPVERLLSVMGDSYLSRAQLMARLGLLHKPTFRKNYLLPALKRGVVVMSHPDKPNSPKQKYLRMANNGE